MTVFDLILMRYLLHYGPILVKKCRVIFCIMRYAISSLRYTFLKVIMQRTNTGKKNKNNRFRGRKLAENLLFYGKISNIF